MARYERPWPWTVIEYGEEEGQVITLGVTHFLTKADALQHVKWVQGLKNYSVVIRLFRVRAELVKMFLEDA